jgi:polyhydroxyalkanoate synthesis regulator phasin
MSTCVRVVWALFLIAFVWIAPAAAAKRVALVIGNSAYTHAPPLPNPVNDANNIAEQLRGLDFAVSLGIDATKAETDIVLREFADALEGADIAIFFYAGHGLQVAGQNYLVPIDAKLAKERDLEFEAVRLDFILKQMELGREDKTNIVFLDACRDNPLSRSLARNMGTRSTSVGKGLAQVAGGVGTFIAYSTQPGNVALDGTGTNSPFTAALLKRMTEPGKNLTSVMIDVRKDVIAATNGQQVPWDHSSLTGDFYFDPNAKPGDATALQGRVKELEQEVEAKVRSATVATQASLTQLRQRVKQMEAETRRDWQKVHSLSRKKLEISDSRERGEITKEIAQLHFGIVDRGRDVNELKSEIERLEKELGPSAAAAAETGTDAKE